MKRAGSKTDVAASTVKRIRTLHQIAEDLHGGEDFSITRLTILKSLCSCSDAAAQFALYLAKKTQQAMRKQSRNTETRTRHKRLVGTAVRRMTEYRKNPTSQQRDSLWKLLAEILDQQNHYEHQRWGAVRIIESRELLVVETALQCVLHPTHSAEYGYLMARQYAQRYDSRHGTGMIPASAPLVEDIVAFWGSHFLGRGWRKQLA